MYFTLSNKPNSLLKFHRQMGNLYLSTSNDLNFYGYKLNQYGGNFCEFLDDRINFSFHKDFKLYTNDNILLTNLEIEGTQLDSSIVSFNTLTHEYTRYNLDTNVELSYPVVLKNVYDILLENIKTCISLTEPKIVYTAGLDSSTLAYIAHANNIDFTCLIDCRYEGRFKNLPFKKIKYVEFQRYPDFNIHYGPTSNVKEGFYQIENNMLITGYYGDNCVVHNSDMFHQSKNIHPNNDSIFVYDRKQPTPYNLYTTKEEIKNGITYINTQNYFRHWFDDFQILDPYRDPRLPTNIMSLEVLELIEQIGSAKIQKDIIASLDKSWVNNLCEYKNNYDKF